MRETCEIFKCSYVSLYRWIKRYEKQGNIKRKQTKKKPYNLCTKTGTYEILRDGSKDQQDFTYKYPSEKIKNLFKNN